MPQIQFELTEEQDKKLELLKAEWKLVSKAFVIRKLINDIEIDVRIKK